MSTKSGEALIAHSPIRSFSILYSSYRTLFKIAGYSVIPSVARSAAEGEVEESYTPNSLRFLDRIQHLREDRMAHGDLALCCDLHMLCFKRLGSSAVLDVESNQGIFFT